MFGDEVGDAAGSFEAAADDEGGGVAGGLAVLGPAAAGRRLRCSGRSWAAWSASQSAWRRVGPRQSKIGAVLSGRCARDLMEWPARVSQREISYGQLTQRIDAAGTADFTYTNGRPTTVTDPVTRTIQTLGYNTAGQLSTIDYGVVAGPDHRLRRLRPDELRHLEGRLPRLSRRSPTGTTPTTTSPARRPPASPVLVTTPTPTTNSDA